MTTWQEIKDRVELKVADSIDAKDFVVFANSALSELNDIAYIEGPTIYYDDDLIIDSAEEIVFSMSDINSSAGKLNLPFTYVVGANQIKVTNTSSVYAISEFGLEFTDSSVLEVSNYAAIDPDTTITVTLKGDPLGENKDLLGSYRARLKLPSNFNTVIRLEAKSIKDFRKMEITQVSINDFGDDNVIFGVSDPAVFYLKDGYMNIISKTKFTEVTLKYNKTMNKLDGITDLGVQNIELDDSYSNLLTYGITYKFMENTVGADNSEAAAIYEKYYIAKQEFIQYNVSKRRRRTQSRMEVWG